MTDEQVQVLRTQLEGQTILKASTFRENTPGLPLNELDLRLGNGQTVEISANMDGELEIEYTVAPTSGLLPLVPVTLPPVTELPVDAWPPEKRLRAIQQVANTTLNVMDRAGHYVTPHEWDALRWIVWLTQLDAAALTARESLLQKVGWQG